MKILIARAEDVKTEKLGKRNGVVTSTGMRGRVEVVGMGISGFIKKSRY
jgi:hypothetical protein